MNEKLQNSKKKTERNDFRSLFSLLYVVMVNFGLLEAVEDSVL